jgi:hypothetical protein
VTETASLDRRDRRIEALEKKLEVLAPQIAKDILDQLRGQKTNPPPQGKQGGVNL